MFSNKVLKSTDAVKADLKNENKNFNLFSNHINGKTEILCKKNAELLKRIEYEKEKGKTLSKNIMMLMQSILDENSNPEMNEFIQTALNRYLQIKNEDEEALLIHEWLVKIKDFRKPRIASEGNRIKKLSIA